MNKPRLINANKLDREDLCDVCGCAYCADCFSDENFEEWIKNQPTAYDIDKVVERLEEERDRPFADCNLTINGICANDREIVASKVAIKYAIEIVKGGVGND